MYRVSSGMQVREQRSGIGPEDWSVREGDGLVGVVSDVNKLARQLEQAWETRRLIEPLSVSAGLETVEHAYAVQSAWTALRVRNGERVIGRKVGLTSKAMQEQAGFDQPDFGSLWASRYFQARDGRVEVPSDIFLQPRIEGEIAFLLAGQLAGRGVTLGNVLDATEALAVSFEVVDSRFVRQNFKVLDTIADNASYGAFTLGAWSSSMKKLDLRTIGMRMTRNGELVVEGTGADSLGHPAHAVAWLANKLAEFDVHLQSGDIVLSGSLGKAIPVQQGDAFMLEMSGQETLTVQFT